MKINYRLAAASVIAAAIALRIFLLFLSPVSMFADGISRYLPAAMQAVNGNFSFFDFPVFIILEAVWALFLKGKALWIAWKATSFIFFIAILFLLPKIFRKFNLSMEEKIISLAIFLFSTWSLLLSASVMQETLSAFFFLALFIAIENYHEKPSNKNIFAMVLLAALLLLTKATGYILMAGFGLYILCRKSSAKRRMLLILFLVFGMLLAAGWPIKNYIATGKAFVAAPHGESLFHSFSEYKIMFFQAYHYFWEIPMPSKVELSGFGGFGGAFHILYSLYYMASLAITALLSFLIIAALFKYCRRYKEYIALILPVTLFSLIYWSFFVGHTVDAGRYIFPVWIFISIFSAKFAASMKNKTIKFIVYMIIFGFCVVSIASALGIAMHMHSIDSQIVQISHKLEDVGAINAQTKLISNDEFTANCLSFYTGKTAFFNLGRNVIDTSLNCSGNPLFSSENFDVFNEAEEYRICRYYSWEINQISQALKEFGFLRY